MDPHDPLRRVVDRVVVGGASIGASERPVIPDGMVDIVWEPGREPWLAGPDTRPHRSTVEQPAAMVRVQFRRGRAIAALGVGLDELVDTRYVLSDLVPDPRWDAVAETERAADAVQQILAVVRDAVADGWEPDQEVEAALAGASTSLSDRQLRRRFTRAVGFGPRTLGRIDRFERFLSAAERTASLADAAAVAVAGYADQPHLSRECRRLTGMTPAAFLRA